MASKPRFPHYAGFLSLALVFSPGLATPIATPTTFPNSPVGSSPLLAQTIAQGCTPAQIEQYIAAFQDPWQRNGAIAQLATACGQTATRRLIQVLQTDPTPTIRDAAASALAYIGGTSATQALIAALPTDSDPTVRETVADALGYLRAASAINPLIATLNQPDEERKVRQAAAKALGAIGGERAIDALLTTLGDTQADLNLRSSASDALKQIGDPAIPPLLTKLQAADLRSRYWAVVALAEMNSSASTQALQSNQAQVDQILADADKAGIVEYDRVPVDEAARGTEAQLAGKPIICKIDWIAKYWPRCR